MKRFKYILLAFLVITAFSACNRVDEVDSKSFVTAIGFDKGENYNLRFTFVFTTPSESNSVAPEGSKDETIVIEAPSLYSAIEQIDSFKSKTVDLTHTQTIIFSTALAEEGLSEYIYMLVRSNNFRPNTYVCIADKSSMEFLETIKPIQTYHLEKYFKLIFRKMSAGTKGDMYLYRAYFSLLSEGHAGLLPYCAINEVSLKKNSELSEAPTESSSDSPLDSPSESETVGGRFAENTDDYAINIIAGGSISKSENNAEVQGAAIVKNGALVSLLGRKETIAVQMITNNMPNMYTTLSDPMHPERMITCYIVPTNRTKIKVECKENPIISIDVQLEGDFAELGEDNYYIKNPKHFEAYFEEKAKEALNDLLEKIKNMNCDICGFSEIAKMNFATVDDWKAYDWNSKFPYAQFNVNVEMTIRTYGELS